ncbi:hypothetical protein [Shimazuella kribbensis]|uniref:hypothetical protein n=1 Tax=Shimazuella kribbensis TaxID=139808 RepID=UPI00040D613F|nr:hypothetical protein [Shimazuella kribbensis]
MENIKFTLFKNFALPDSLFTGNPHVGQNGELFITYYSNRKGNGLYKYRVFHFTPQELKEYFFELEVDKCEVDKIEEDTWIFLNVSPEEEMKENLFIYNNKREKWNKSVVGTGIVDWHIDHKKIVWITYDELGLFGEVELAQSGFVQLTIDGKRQRNILEKPIFNQRIPNILEGICINSNPDDKIWFYYYSGQEYCLVKFDQTGETCYKNFSLDQIGNRHPIRWMVNKDQVFLLGDPHGNIYRNFNDDFSNLEKLNVLDENNEQINFDWMSARHNIIWGIKGSNIYSSEII